MQRNEKFRELHEKARLFYTQEEYLDLSSKESYKLIEDMYGELILEECFNSIRSFNLTEEQSYNIIRSIYNLNMGSN